MGKYNHALNMQRKVVCICLDIWLLKCMSWFMSDVVHSVHVHAPVRVHVLGALCTLNAGHLHLFGGALEQAKLSPWHGHIFFHSWGCTIWEKWLIQWMHYRSSWFRLWLHAMGTSWLCWMYFSYCFTTWQTYSDVHCSFFFINILLCRCFDRKDSCNWPR